MSESYNPAYTPNVGDTERELLVKILNLLRSGTVGGGQMFSGNYAGGPPTDVPSGDTAIAFDTSDGTQWDYYGGQWH